jgi:hypothetical protein
MRTIHWPSKLLRPVLIALLLVLVSGCGRNGPATAEEQPANTVAGLLASAKNQPAQSVLLDAYAHLPIRPSSAQERRVYPTVDGCVATPPYGLVPRLVDTLYVDPFGAGESHSFVTAFIPPELDSPWLIPVVTEPNNTFIPYHARYQGHLNDPKYAHCPYADRLFVVEKIVTVYTQDPPTPEPMSTYVHWPTNLEAWKTMRPASGGYSFLYPPDWQLTISKELDTLETITLTSPTNSAEQIVIQTYAGEQYYDPLGGSEDQPPLLRSGYSSFAIFDPAESHSFGPNAVIDALPKQHLTVYGLSGLENAEVSSRIVVNGAGNAHSFTLHAADRRNYAEISNIFRAVIVSIRFDEMPKPIPTPVIKDQLGAGPFLDDAGITKALASYSAELAQIHVQMEFRFTSKELLSEKEYRERFPDCTFAGHPDGIWLLHGTLSVSTQGDGLGSVAMDATTGGILCFGHTGPVTPPKPTAFPTRLPQPPGSYPAPTNPAPTRESYPAP